jgi:hypothetical protein
MTFLKNIIIFVLVIIIGYKYEPEWKYIREKYNLYEIDISNMVNITSMIDLTSMINLKTFLNNENKIDMNESYSKEILLSITKEKEIEIINNLVLIITKNIINEANEGHRNYYWEDKKYYLNKIVLEMLLIKLSDKLPNVKITNEYFKSLRLIFDWN